MKIIDPDVKVLIKQTKEKIRKIKQQMAATEDPDEKSALKRQLVQYQRQQLGYLGKLG